MEKTCCPNPDCEGCRTRKVLPNFLEMLDKLSDVELYPVLEIIKTLYGNIEKFPDQSKYRTVPLAAARIKRDLANVPEAIQFLLSSGWICKDGNLIYESDLEFILVCKKLCVDAEKVRDIRRQYLDEQKKS